MEQAVRYCETSDGSGIAYTTLGTGFPLVVPPNILNSHIQVELGPGSKVRPFYERLAERLMVIRYDARGTGASPRGVVDHSAEAGEQDLLAVVDRLGLDRFALYDHVLAGLAPAALAAHHPDRVACVVWWVGQTITIAPETARRIEMMALVRDADWGLYCDVVARLINGWDAPIASYLAELMRAGTSPSANEAAVEQIFLARDVAFGASEKITVPTLVAHIEGAAASAGRARKIASRIPDARLVAVPGHPQTSNPIGDDNPVLTAAIADFVEGGAVTDDRPQQPVLQLAAMRAILFTDVVAHTTLMDRLGDAKGRELLRQHEQVTREQLAIHGGAEVKAMGDGFMAWFASAQRALECAIALQRAFAARNATANEPFEIRAGLNAGEPIVEDHDMFGASVIAAARICDEAGGGEIVVSDVVRQLVAGKGFSFTDRGAVELKGFEEPVRLSAALWGA